MSKLDTSVLNKMIFYFLLFIALVLAKDAQTDARISSTFNSLMREFEQDLAATALQSAKVDYNKQHTTNGRGAKNIQQIYMEYKAESDALFTTFKPIARQIIESAAYNKNFKYYIYDDKVKAWHLYGRQPPNPAVDGSKENARILAAELKDAWIKLLGSNGSSGMAASMKATIF